MLIPKCCSDQLTRENFGTVSSIIYVIIRAKVFQENENKIEADKV